MESLGVHSWIDKLLNLNRVSKVYLILASAYCFLVMVLATLQLMTGYTTVGTTSTGRHESSNGVQMYIYWCTLELVTTAFVLYLAWSSIFSESRFEMFAFQLATFVASIYAVIQYYTVDEERNTVGAVQLVLILTFQVAFWSLSYTLHKSFGWLSFRRLGADPALKKMYANYQLFVAQLKFDCQFGLTVLLMSIFFFIHVSIAFVVVEIIMLGVTIGYVYLGYRGVREENTSLMNWFYAIGTIEPINIIIKAILIMDDPDKYGENAPYPQLAVTAFLALLNRVTLIINAKRAVDNFGRGLKENAFDPKGDDVTDPTPMDVGLLPVFGSLGASSTADPLRVRHPSLSGTNDYDPNLTDPSALFSPTLE